MKNNILSPYSQAKSKHTYNIVDDLKVSVTVTANPFGLSPDTLFAMAARMNKKRAFLFVSKVLGKHLPVNPYTSLLSGAALSLLLYKRYAADEQQHALANELLDAAIEGLTNPGRSEQVYHQVIEANLKLPEQALFIGFAETATALGHSMYRVFSEDCTYLHTTREQIPAMESLISFEEEHSHAVAHRCYALDAAFFNGNEPIVLVDDELTTGKTALNIIRDIQRQFPRRQYIVASLLDWRTEADEQRFVEAAQELGVSIEVLSLMKGAIRVEGSSPEQVAASAQTLAETPASGRLNKVYLDELFELASYSSVDSAGAENASPYVAGTGRFGVRSSDNGTLDASVAEAGAKLRSIRTGERTLCLGTGEFMYIPMRIAAELGQGVFYHSTTRSPVHPIDKPDYAIKSGQAFPSPEDEQVRNFFYNVGALQYDDCFIFAERDWPEDRLAPLLSALQACGFGQINVIVCGPSKGSHKEEKA
ncbi:phosphoribosyltransferase family protein [Paenibacillus algorifonticola]|uniref:phosphoribosyltransferase family protein n=1 Tax=Paenibacillus algorifonticola TaxID=684063 RepID=UPI003D2B57B0